MLGRFVKLGNWLKGSAKLGNNQSFFSGNGMKCLEWLSSLNINLDWLNKLQYIGINDCLRVKMFLNARNDFENIGNSYKFMEMTCTFLEIP